MRFHINAVKRSKSTILNVIEVLKKRVTSMNFKGNQDTILNGSLYKAILLVYI